MKPLHTMRHTAIYMLIAVHVVIKYFFKLSPRDYAVFIRRAWTLLIAFRHNRIMRVKKGYKLQLYLPAYPSQAFFHALENKLLRSSPAPTSVVFSMTRACAYHCPHCYQKKDKGTDLDDTLVQQTLRAVQEIGVSYFNIEGGEPFLRFDRLLRLVQSLDDRAEVWVNTTGDKVTQEQLCTLQKQGLDGIMVSLHSPDAAVHDAFTGVPGSFMSACRVITLSKQLGLGVAINSVLAESELRSGRLQELMELAKTLHIDFVQLIHPKPCGAWLEKQDDMQQDVSLLRMVEEQHVFYNSSRTAGYPSLASQVFEERSEGVGCTAGGIDRFYVSAAGDVQPCEFLQLSFGNVTREPFERIYDRMRQAFAIPGTHWLCCTQAQSIAACMQTQCIQTTPIPVEYASEIIKNCDKGSLTALYAKLGIYS